MPELPEVETVVRGLSRLVGWRVAEVHLARADIQHGRPVPLCVALHGRRIRAVSRRAKQVWLQTDGDWSLVVHLGMTGRLVLADAQAPIEPHTHLRIVFQRRRTELRFCDPRRFGGLWVVTRAESDGEGWIGRRLPPAGRDALDLPLNVFRAALTRRRQIKALLLDQQPIGGMGNIYCDESLFRAGVHPTVRASDLDAATVRRLHAAIRRVLTEAVRAGGSSISDYRTAENTLGYFQRRLRVYGRAGQPCLKCGAVIERLVVAGRGTFVCPQCQRQKAQRHKGRRGRGAKAASRAATVRERFLGM
ncbi:MAG: bifunctional DNA-formamidopyrimidine glycosylase/DNA-(apurinic or apyrimidinic site) lyase [Phycisphaerae bacterium]|nr:bifunctional DNA-formamidopyrimidine glycosylase/DNA-(apurinic or apyrimidinic site) lyase [Phycisphaerae bacterium]